MDHLVSNGAVSRVVVVGKSALNYVVRCGEFESGSKVEVDSIRVFPAGQGANVAFTLAALECSVHFIGAFGDDDRGALVRQVLTEVGVDLEWSTTTHCESPISLVWVNSSTAERTIFMHRDPRLTVTTTSLPPQWATGTELAYFDGWEPELSIRMAEQAKAAGTRIVIDVERLNPQSEQLVELANDVIAPGSIVQELLGGSSPHDALLKLGSDHRVWVATLGEEGALGREPGGDVVHVPAKAVKVVDTTGAGDAFHAGYMVGVTHQLSFERRLRFATQVAALCCEHEGSRAPADLLRAELHHLAQ